MLAKLLVALSEHLILLLPELLESRDHVLSVLEHLLFVLDLLLNHLFVLLLDRYSLLVEVVFHWFEVSQAEPSSSHTAILRQLVTILCVLKHHVELSRTICRTGLGDLSIQTVGLDLCVGVDVRVSWLLFGERREGGRQAFRA